MTLRGRLAVHDWDADPDDSYALTERLELLKILRKMPLCEVAELLKTLPPTVAFEAYRLMEINAKKVALNTK